jgi:hypothetical protein
MQTLDPASDCAGIIRAGSWVFVMGYVSMALGRQILTSYNYG